MNTSKYEPRWFYVRDKNNNPVGCVATIQVRDKEVIYAVSALNPKDDWDMVKGKHVPHFGRSIALNRLEIMQPYPWMWKVAWLGNELSIKEQIIERLAYSAETRYARVREAAKYWLSDEARKKRLEKIQEKKHGNRSS